MCYDIINDYADLPPHPNVGTAGTQRSCQFAQQGVPTAVCRLCILQNIYSVILKKTIDISPYVVYNVY